MTEKGQQKHKIENKRMDIQKKQKLRSFNPLVEQKNRQKKNNLYFHDKQVQIKEERAS